MYPDQDDLSGLLAFGEDDHAYAPDADDWAEPREPTAEEAAAEDAFEAERIDRDFAPFQVAADEAIALLRARGIVARAEFDADVDDDTGATSSWYLLHVDCHPGCGPVAEIDKGHLSQRGDCEAPEGVDSKCAEADEALAADGAFADGWAR